MFYRQKILLALVEVSGGKLSNTDLEKLLFLYCKTTNQNFYDFFPYKFGAFSFISYYDKRKLIEKGILKEAEGFEVESATTYLNALKPRDRENLREFAVETYNLRGRELIKKTYLSYPEYAVRSEIAETILNKEEYYQTRLCWNKDTVGILFTIGYEGKTIDQYLFELLSHNVEVLVDVRQNPLSRKHGFSKKSLKKYTQKVGIQYLHLPELGVPSRLRKGLNSAASYRKLFEHYALSVLPKKQKEVEKIKCMLIQQRRLALTCFEADPNMCHRHTIAEFIESDSKIEIPLEHI